MTLTVRGREVLCACGAALREDDRLAGSNLFACRQRLHGRPLIWHVWPGSAAPTGANADESAVGRQLLVLERDLAEVIRTSRLSGGTSPLEADVQDPATKALVERSDPGVEVGVRVGPDDLRVLARELRDAAARLDGKADAEDVAFARRVFLRGARALGGGVESVGQLGDRAAANGYCSCGYDGPWADRRHDLTDAFQPHRWHEGPRPLTDGAGR